MPPTHPSQVDVAAAYRTLIAHETEPKEQDFYRTRLQRLEQAAEPECEFDCRRRVAAAGVGVYCPQCSAKCADTDLATQLAKAIRAAWVDRLDWDELAHAALEFLTSTGRLIPAGGRALTAEQAEDVRIVTTEEVGGYTGEQFRRWHAAKDRLVESLFSATAPVPAEPAEEETKAELCAVRLCVLPARHSGVHADREGLRWNNPTSSPVVPAPTETGPRYCSSCKLNVPPAPYCTNCGGDTIPRSPTETGLWQTWQEVPDQVAVIRDRDGDRWKRSDAGSGWKYFSRKTSEWTDVGRPSSMYAPFVAAEEG
ncbi:hypothetical protein ACFVWF_32160 [Rhodococcus qingshengii]|uniref:hypothetical protein n=1 Tax=Rhodococcus qingshengii TaxID=334542 RepID=UPI0036DB5BB6